MNKYITIIGTAILSALVGWTACEYQQTCPGDKLCTLERAKANPAETAKYCEDLIPQQVPEIVTEYVPRYIKTVCPVCDCSAEISTAIQQCIKGYEEFQPAQEVPCVGIECTVNVYRGSKQN